MSEIFEDRFVVFIDILGFAAMVSAAKREPSGEMARRVDAGLTRIENMKLFGGDRIVPEPAIDGFHSHIFSDCIVMSVAPGPKAVSQLFTELSKLTLQLMEIGVWIRGGMSMGKISVRKSAPWGPAIVEAYDIESKLAKYPRIALSRTAIEFVRNTMEGNEEENYLVRDGDGVWSLAPFAWAIEDAKKNGAVLTEDSAQRIKLHLEKAHMEAVDNPDVFRKIDWLMDKWDWHLKPTDGVPSFDCRTELGKKHDLVDIFNAALED